MGNNENSGVINFGIKEYMNEQFNKVRKNQKRDYLTISEVISYLTKVTLNLTSLRLSF